MATNTEDSPERLDADENRGRLIVSEHRGRYLWGAQLAAGMRVLDAGCGTGYGLGILADAGAATVIGVDISEIAVAHASESNPDRRIEVVRSDLRGLPFPDGEFDLVVCFEVIEHVDEREAILDELARVLSADGVLCISTPNSRVYPPGNPFHVHEYEPQELAAALGKRFGHVALHRQTAWLASAILSEAEFAASGSEEALSLHTVKLDSRDPGQETFTVALASQQQVSEPPALLTLGEPFEVRWWQEKIDMAHRRAEAQVANALRAVADAEDARRHNACALLEVEEVLAQSKARIFALEEAADEHAERVEALRQQAERATRVMAAMEASVSWRITAPLRALKRLR
jgi:2-polyprenyl-3-methyl-5-hydroxy-6-metoxy-1,4-benzoquinol methylase